MGRAVPQALPTQQQRTHEILAQLSRLRVLPIATIGPEHALPLGRSLVEAGLPCVEITFRTAGAARAIERARETDGLLVGAGTVLTRDQAADAAAAGAAFAVAPGLNQDVVESCAELGLPFFPGAATPTEIDRARYLGLRTVKVFPVASLGGTPFLRAVAATFPDVRFIPTGGINATNVNEYLALPSVVACAGSWLITPRDVATGQFDAIAARVRETLARVPCDSSS